MMITSYPWLLSRRGGRVAPLGLWPKLTTYLEDGPIEIDNNKAENAIRPFVIGRNYAQFVIMRSSLPTPVVDMCTILLPVAA